MNFNASSLKHMDGNPELGLSHLLNRLRQVGLHREALVLEDCGRRLCRRRAGDAFLPMKCRRKFCPICRPSLARRTFLTYEDPVKRLIAQGGAARFLTFTLPCDGENHLESALRIHKDLRSFVDHPRWKGRKGLVNRVGVLSGLEFSLDKGTPHGHQLIFGQSLDDADEFSAWHQMLWLKAHPDARFVAQDDSGPFTALPDVLEKLGYICKGSLIGPSWSDSAIKAAVEAISGYRRPITACGLGMRIKKVSADIPPLPVDPHIALVLDDGFPLVR